MYLIIENDVDLDMDRIKKIISIKTDISDANRLIKRLEKYCPFQPYRFSMGSASLDEDDKDVVARISGLDTDDLEWDE